MRMKIRRAAMREYLTAATRMASEINKSCHSTCTLAHVSNPVNPTASMLSGSGLTKRSRHLIPLNIDRPFSFPDSPSCGPSFSSLWLGVGSFFNSLSFLLASATTSDLAGLVDLGKRRRCSLCGSSERETFVVKVGVIGKWVVVRPNIPFSLFTLIFSGKYDEREQ
ncbi:hypothetical protein TorRG33x02_190850 [Trema orientale]|uniref:Uncharacterized protein n=1 Tax=Trema orientale TaxID=63057 RepID=A0A2P5EHT7_TREOI|nr:hypothetical protein TorRG33x02_190850 [Trema orientale]